jgi:hypothetical protein
MDVRIVGQISEIETIAEGHGIRELANLRERYGRGNWRKKKRIAAVKSLMVSPPRQKSIGMKLTVSAKLK